MFLFLLSYLRLRKELLYMAVCLPSLVTGEKEASHLVIVCPASMEIAGHGVKIPETFQQAPKVAAAFSAAWHSIHFLRGNSESKR